MSRTHLWAALAVCTLLVVSSAHGDYLDDFLQDLQDDIDSGDVSEVDSGYPAGMPPDYPQDRPRITGWTYWPDLDSAPCTWVRAVATDSQEINGWAHTSWPTGGYPHSNCAYEHSIYTPQPIEYNHCYYLKGLHWLPKTVYDWPEEDQMGPIPPLGAQGVVHSPTYVTEEWNNTDHLRQDVCLSGPPAMW